MTCKLLIVDDEQPNLRLLQRIFSSEYECFTASSGPAAIQVLQQHDIAIIITDQRMPGMSGIDLLKATATLRPHMVRILLTGYTDVEALVETINCGLVYMYFTKPWNNDELKLKVKQAREHYENNKKRSGLELANARFSQKLEAITLTVVKSLIEMGRSTNEDHYHHALRVCKQATAIARKMQLSNDEINELATAALLHNLNCAGGSSFTTGSTIEQTHAQCEMALLESIPELAQVADVIRLQRENFDGSGNPMGLGAEQIPVSSRIIRVADEYDLMLNQNATIPMLPEAAMRSLGQSSGKQFDPQVVDVLAEISSNNDEQTSIGGEAQIILAGLTGITTSGSSPLVSAA